MPGQEMQVQIAHADEVWCIDEGKTSNIFVDGDYSAAGLPAQQQDDATDRIQEQQNYIGGYLTRVEEERLGEHSS
jgi:hypothetical protein